MQRPITFLLLALASTSVARAQLPEVGVPRGAVRFEITGELKNFDSRFNQGRTEVYTADFQRAAIGGEFFPDLLPAEATIGRIAGMPSYRLSIGRTATQGDANLGTLGIGLAIGLTDRLTIFGTVPIVRQRVQTFQRFDAAGANAGFNPADPLFGTLAGAAEAAAFFTEFDNALTMLSDNLAAGLYDADPTLRALAEQTLSDGTVLRDDLLGVVSTPGTATPFLPLSTSGEGAAIIGTIATLQGTLDTSLGVTGFATQLPLPTTPLTQADYLNFIENPSGPIAALPLAESEDFLLGDIEVGASYALLDRWDRHGKAGGIRTYAQVMARLPTGYRPTSNDLIGLGTGDRQLDVAVGIVTDIGRGRVGARIEGSYTRQFAGTLERRVTTPDRPIPFANRLASVRWDPGDVFRVSIQPFIAITRTLALQGRASYWRRGEDSYEYASSSDAIAGVSAGELGQDSDANATVVGGGITYRSPSATDPLRPGLPVEAYWHYEGVVRAEGARVPKAKTARMGLRLYFRLWGG